MADTGEVLPLPRRARFRLLGFAGLLLAGGCEKAGAETRSPEPELTDTAVAETQVEASAEATTEVKRSADDASGPPRAFSFVIRNRCPQSWRAQVVPAKAHRGHTEASEIVMQPEAKHTLSMRVGDVLVFTSADGGITAVNFESWEQGEGAEVEVVDACTGILRTHHVHRG